MSANRAAASKRIRTEAVNLLGGECAHCGFDDMRALQIDHVNGGGTQESKRLGPVQMYRKIVRGETDGYQILCANCNSIKKIENDETWRVYEREESNV